MVFFFIRNISGMYLVSHEGIDVLKFCSEKMWMCILIVLHSLGCTYNEIMRPRWYWYFMQDTYKMNHCYSFTRFFPNKCFIVVKWYCNSTFICMLEIFVKFAKASLSRIFLAACKSTFYGLSNNIRVDKIWMRKLVTANQLISGSSQN